jgi:TonB family protein
MANGEWKMENGKWRMENILLMSWRKPYRLFLLSILILAALPASFAQEDLWRAQRHYELGRQLYRNGQRDKAIEELYTAVSIREVYFEAQMLLARSLLLAKRPREAVATLRGIETVEQGKVPYQKLLGQAYYEVNKLRAAERALTYAIAEAPRPDPELHYYLGLVLLRYGEGDAAVREAKRALVIAPAFGPARKLLSDAYLAESNVQRAAQELARYLRGVRNRTEAVELRNRLRAIKSLARARPDSSVKAEFLPPRIHRIPRPNYTDEARNNRIEGEVRVEILFGHEGTIHQVLVVRGLGFGLDEEAVRAVKGIEFTPGSLGDKPISVWWKLSIQFSLTDNKKKEREGSERIAAAR